MLGKFLLPLGKSAQKKNLDTTEHLSIISRILCHNILSMHRHTHIGKGEGGSKTPQNGKMWQTAPLCRALYKTKMELLYGEFRNVPVLRFSSYKNSKAFSSETNREMPKSKEKFREAAFQISSAPLVISSSIQVL